VRLLSRSVCNFVCRWLPIVVLGLVGGSGHGAAPTATVLVPAGEFLRGDADGSGEPDERPAKRIQVSCFAIDRTEVTVAAYARCVAAGRCAKPPGPGGERPELPVTGVSWSDAAAYCSFAGGRLPTEAEWEKAARGADGRLYPWGPPSTALPESLCVHANFGTFAGDGRCAEQGAPGRPIAVGSFPSGASPFGALDMAGNVWEWVEDRYDPAYYQRAPLRDPKGPAGPLPSGMARRVLRGGGCCSIFGLPRVTDRLAMPEDYRDVDIGFRCAYRPESCAAVAPADLRRNLTGAADPR